MKQTKPRDQLILALHKAQSESPNNFLSNETLKKIAIEHGVSLVELTGTASFYSMFSTKPRGKYIIRVCESLPCRISGSIDIYLSLEEKLGIKNMGTTQDKLFTLEVANCIGCCDQAPAMMINDELYTNLTVNKVNEIIETIKKKEGVND